MAGNSTEDGAATLTAITAAAIARAIALLPRAPTSWIVAGGGTRNPTLMKMIRARLPECEVLSHEDFSINGKAKEAIALAIIANDAIAGLNTNIPGATGGRPTVLGKISV